MMIRIEHATITTTVCRVDRIVVTALMVVVQVVVIGVVVAVR
jgi:hypothetical protein